MSTRTKSSYQDPRYLQLWLVFDWPKPIDLVPVSCAGCAWTGRRQKRTAIRRPCPSCAGPIITGTRTAKDRPRAAASTRDRSRRAAGYPVPVSSARYARPALVPVEQTADSSAYASSSPASSSIHRAAASTAARR